MLAALTDKAGEIGERAVARAQERLIARAVLPDDVSLSADAQGLILSGKALRRRRLNDPRLRNFAQ